MSMNEKVREGLLKQVGRELEAAYLYRSMASWFESQDLPGFASWMRSQAAEEREHAERIVGHLEDRGVHVSYPALKAPPSEFGSALEAVRTSLEHERKVTGHIHDLYELAGKEGDAPARVMLAWFVEEQVEEENTVSRIVSQLERAGDSGPTLLMLDARMGERGEA